MDRKKRKKESYSESPRCINKSTHSVEKTNHFLFNIKDGKTNEGEKDGTVKKKFYRCQKKKRMVGIVTKEKRKDWMDSF